MADINRICEDAVDKYTSNTGVNISSEFKGIESLDDAFVMVKQEKAKFETYRKQYELVQSDFMAEQLTGSYNVFES